MIGVCSTTRAESCSTEVPYGGLVDLCWGRLLMSGCKRQRLTRLGVFTINLPPLDVFTLPTNHPGWSLPPPPPPAPLYANNPSERYIFGGPLMEMPDRSNTNMLVLCNTCYILLDEAYCYLFNYAGLTLNLQQQPLNSPT